LDEDDLQSIRNYHWDYWHFIESEIGDHEVAATFPDTNPDILPHASFVRNLPADYNTSAIITPDGTWHDLQDHGWRLINEPCLANQLALDKWKQQVQELMRKFKDHIAIEVSFHC
jgi:hypothetical protein